MKKRVHKKTKILTVSSNACAPTSTFVPPRATPLVGRNNSDELGLGLGLRFREGEVIPCRSVPPIYVSAGVDS